MEKDKEEIIDPVVDDNTVVDDEVVDTMPDETLAQTDEVIPAPVDPVLPEIPIDTIPASTSEPLTVEEPVDSDVVPGAGDELPTDIAEPVDVPVEEPVPGECPNCEGEGCPDVRLVQRLCRARLDAHPRLSARQHSRRHDLYRAGSRLLL